MDLSSQHWINLELTRDIPFKIIIPLSIPDEIKDVANLETRDWLVPGEKLIIFVEMGRCITSLDEFSFYCTVTDAEHTPQFKRRQRFLSLSSMSTKKHLPNLSTIKVDDGRMYFPVRIQVPNSTTRRYVVSAFCLRNTTPVTQLECYSLQPFIVTWSKHLTPQSIIVLLSIKCNIPENWKENIPISAANLKFNESAEDEQLFSKSIAIIKTADSSYTLSNGDVASVAFTLKPLSDEGAIRVSKMPLSFSISWKASEIEYVATFPFNVGKQKSDLVISAPMVKCELLKPSSIPLRITNMKNEPRKVDLCFGSGKIQPMTKRQEIDFQGGFEAKSIEFGFIPLCIGEHKLKIWAEDGEDSIYPMFPICLSVEKPQQ
ncbi:hypothetical protein TRFO_41891 [Tritrichomonas foetus]|uniref:Trafficking protein particle complex subunit 11 C-terminal domain-containing protein n=1 Tax=Tritrichomonas foetus TaxID=1144522 RepID=A0A1J4KYK4_9EUKA|nr:hypothetical protein TRFO_41891 [Tritrichomonas foetus]|eukprot:OHT16319.1 hypothetical protein TRFO_41891 [Tritrichomonas foetus]